MPVGIIPAGVPELEPYLRPDLDVVRVGRDVFLEDFDPPRVEILARELRVSLEVAFTSRHQLVNLLSAVAAAQAVGVEPSGRVDVSFGALRGERVSLPSGAVVINDCYNANPLSMRAALDDLATQAPEGRRVAVLGDMLELGPDERAAHREIGAYAASSGVDVLVAVGPAVGGDGVGVRRRVARRGRRGRGRLARGRVGRPGRRRAGQGLTRDRPGDGGGGARPWVRS